ncbi:MAG: hypothetical protein U0401_20680 [Anaerolineae bacterium]
MQVVIVGLGLMGGSLGLALKQHQVCCQIVGLACRKELWRQPKPPA